MKKNTNKNCQKNTSRGCDKKNKLKDLDCNKEKSFKNNSSNITDNEYEVDSETEEKEETN